MAQVSSAHLKPGDTEIADIIMGNTDICSIVPLVENYIKERKKTVRIFPHTPGEKFNTPEISSFDLHTRAFMKIEDGCERYCTYCVIPYARGFVRSKPVDAIRNEAERLAENGHSEIVLVGINLSAYGKGEGIDLCDAVEAVCAVPGILRVRLGSLEPDHIGDEMLSRFKAQEKFCPQFHLSLQSGCDETLKRMNRHYDTVFFEDLVVRIRKLFPSAAISTDVMVGFPGESDKEFQASIDFVKKIGFARTHVFAYSRRQGTVADKMPLQITSAVKSERSRRMIAAAAACEHDFLSSQIGTVAEVLFETYENGTNFGYTRNYSRVAVKGDIPLCDTAVQVKITGVSEDMCLGVIV